MSKSPLLDPSSKVCDIYDREWYQCIDLSGVSVTPRSYFMKERVHLKVQ